MTWLSNQETVPQSITRKLITHLPFRATAMPHRSAPHRPCPYQTEFCPLLSVGTAVALYIPFDNFLFIAFKRLVMRQQVRPFFLGLRWLEANQPASAIWV